MHCLEAGSEAHLITFADRPSLRSLAGHRHRVSRRASPLAKGAYRISGLEQGAVAQNGVHDDRKAPGERCPRFLEAAPFAIFIARVFNAKVCRERVRIELAAS